MYLCISELKEIKMRQQRIYIDTSIVGGFWGKGKGYNAVNLKNDYKILEIRNPKDLVYYGEKI